MTLTSVLTLPGRPESARAAREFTAACMPGCPAVYEAMLCTDELVTNAVQHSRSGLPGGQITVRVETRPGEWLRVDVEDQGPRLRAVPDDPGEAGELAEHGRGLDLVAVLASETGAGTGLRWFRMAWDLSAQACVPAPRPPRLTAAELRRNGVLDRAGGMCECGGRCGRRVTAAGTGRRPATRCTSWRPTRPGPPPPRRCPPPTSSRCARPAWPDVTGSPDGPPNRPTPEPDALFAVPAPRGIPEAGDDQRNRDCLPAAFRPAVQARPALCRVDGPDRAVPPGRARGRARRPPDWPWSARPGSAGSWPGAGPAAGPGSGRSSGRAGTPASARCAG